MTQRIIMLPADEQQTIDPKMELKEFEVVFVEARGIHSPYHARQYLRTILTKRQDSKLKIAQGGYPQLKQEEDQVAGVCQKVILQVERFKDIYATAYKNGLFNKNDAGEYAQNNPWREKLQEN